MTRTQVSRLTMPLAAALSMGVEHAAGQAAAQPAARGARSPVPVPEPDGLDGYPGKDAGKTKQYVEKKLRWKGKWTGKIPCDTNCGSGANKAFVEMFADANSPAVDLVNMGNLAHGHFVAKIVNRSGSIYGPLNLGNGETALLWVGTVPGYGDTPGIWFYRVGKDGNATLLAQATTLVFCGVGGGAPHVHPDADPACSESAVDPAKRPRTMQIGPATHPSQPPSAAKSMVIHTTGLWVSCTGGCCQAKDIKTF